MRYGEEVTKELKESGNIRIFEYEPKAEEAGSLYKCPLVRLHGAKIEKKESRRYRSVFRCTIYLCGWREEGRVCQGEQKKTDHSQCV